MKREHKINVVFAIVLLALVAPGGVILFRKKSQVGERPIGSPDPVRKTTAYMDPYPAESFDRLAPILTLQWVGGLAMSDTPTDAVRVTRATTQPVVTGPREQRVRLSVGEAIFYGETPGGSPEAQVMSDGRRFQVVARGAGGDGWLRAIIWDANVDEAAITATIDGRPARVLSARRVIMPKTVRHELQEAGYVLPPDNVTVVDVAVPADSARELGLTWGNWSERAALP